MDWALFERLAPSLSWPIVAFLMFIIALPVLHRRLGDLIKAVLAIRDLPKSIQETIKEQERLTLIFKDQISTAKQEIDETAKRVQTIISDLGSIRSEIQFYQSEVQAEALAADSKSLETALGTSSTEIQEPFRTTAEMYELAMGKWSVFLQNFERRLQDANIDYDMRKIGRAAYALTDRRRRSPLSNEEANLITNLARQPRRFSRLLDTRDEWLTPEVYLRFVNGVDVASGAIARGRNG